MKQYLYILPFLFFLSYCANKEGAPKEIITENVRVSEPGKGDSGKLPAEKSDLSQKKIIKEGSVSFETSDLGKTSLEIESALNHLQGYISKENEYNTDDRIQKHFLIRIPAKNFDTFLNMLAKGVEKFDTKNIEIKDVTEEYIDIESRIKTKKAVEEKYNELLKKASKVEELLAIEKQIGELRTEIESIEGRMKYLQNNISYSILNLDVYEKSAGSFGFITKLKNAMGNGWENLLWFGIGLANVWPFFILAGLLIFIVKKISKTRKLKKSNNI